MRKTRRQILVRFFEKFGLAIVLLDIVFYFAAYRPVRGLVDSEQERYAAERHAALRQQARVARLEKFRAMLPEADQNVEAFVHDHIPPRRAGFSRAADLLRNVTQASGADLSNVRFRFDTEEQAPLLGLSMDMSLQGSFSELMKFADALETADDLVLVREFSFVPGDSGKLGLHFKAEMYLTP